MDHKRVVVKISEVIRNTFWIFWISLISRPTIDGDSRWNKITNSAAASVFVF